jgi:hypothetical protein
MDESLVLNSSLALAGTPCKTACGGSSSSLSVASTSPTVYAGGSAAANGVASWAGLYPGKNLAAATPRRRYRHCTPTCRRRVTELLPLLLLCTRRACGALEGSSTTQLSFFWSFGKLLLPPKQWRRGDGGGGELTSTAYGLCRDFQHDNDYYTLATDSARPS